MSLLYGDIQSNPGPKQKKSPLIFHFVTGIRIV